jgi:OmcA/MtrC family decaheme c-type cytochrome
VNVTGGLGYAYSLPATQPLTQTNVAGYPMNASGSGGLIVPIPNVWKPLTGTTGRRAIVDNAKCQACHAPLGVEPTFHVAQRNDGPTCSFCHNPNQSSNGWSANASTFVHGIHGASIRTVPFSWHSGGCAVGSTWNALKRQCEVAGVAVEPAAPWFPEVEYPNQLKNCEACHVAGSYDFSNSDSAAAVTKLLWATVGKDTYTNDSPSNSPYVAFGSSYGVGPSFSATTMALTAGASTSLVNSPISGACFSCHDSTDARTHMEAHGGAIYRARSAGMTGESCLGCHGSTGTWSIKEMHK